MDKAGQQHSMLTFHNKQLRGQLDVKRHEVADLNRKYEQLIQNQTKYEEILLITDRLWKQVERDIQSLAERVTGIVYHKQRPDHCMNRTESGSKQYHPSINDPFQQRLLQADPSLTVATQQSYKTLLADASPLEIGLRKRLSSTMEVLAMVLDEVRKGQQQRLQQAEGQHQSVINPTDGSATSSTSLAQEVLSLQKTVDGQQAYIRALEASLAQTDDEFVKHKEQIRDMNNQLADLDEQLAKARKMQHASNGEHPSVTAIHATLTNGTTPPAAVDQAEQALPQAALLLTKSAEETQQLLSKRESELEQERETTISLQKDIRDLKVQLSSSTSLSQQQLYQELLKDRDTVKADRDKLLGDILQLQKETSRLVTLEQQQSAAERATKHAQELQQASVHAVHELEAKVKQMQEQLDAAQQQLHALKAEYGQQETLAECSKHLEGLQRDLSTERQRMKQLSGKAQELADAKQEVVQANKNLQIKDKQIERLQLKLQKQQSMVTEVKQLKERSEDLRVFVEVLQTLTPEPDDMLRLRASEAVLREKVGKLEADWNGHHLQQTINKLQQAEKEAVESAEALASEQDSLQAEVHSLRAELGNLKQQMADLQIENSTFLDEIDSTSRIYEQTQGENSALLKRMMEGDARLNQVAEEQMKHGQSLEQCRGQLHLAKLDCSHANQLKQTLERQMQELHASLQECSKKEQDLHNEIHTCNASTAQLRREKDELSSRLQQQALQLAGLESSAADRKRALDTEFEKVSRERHKRQRVEEDNKALQAKLEKLQERQSKGSMSTQTEEELEGLRALLRCNVCHERQKDVIITKCMHMFCKPCIQRNLDSRLRKCPGCGAAFGTKDVHQFFFT